MCDGAGALLEARVRIVFARVLCDRGEQGVRGTEYPILAARPLRAKQGLQREMFFNN